MRTKIGIRRKPAILAQGFLNRSKQRVLQLVTKICPWQTRNNAARHSIPSSCDVPAKFGSTTADNRCIGKSAAQDGCKIRVFLNRKKLGVTLHCSKDA